MLFDSFTGLARVLIVGVSAYAALVAMLRISGKRTLSKMNAFDFVVTVALGSILATILLSKDVALAEGILAFALLIGLQFVVAWFSVRSAALRRLVKSEPCLLLYQGAYLHNVLRAERVTEDEVRAAVRAQGIAGLEQVESVVLETDGTFSVARRADDMSASALLDVLQQRPPSP
ncbi:MAG: YetF domain-containing protein [Roseiflexaceae bacterium]